MLFRKEVRVEAEVEVQVEGEEEEEEEEEGGGKELRRAKILGEREGCRWMDG